MNHLSLQRRVQLSYHTWSMSCIDVLQKSQAVCFNGSTCCLCLASFPIFHSSVCDDNNTQSRRVVKMGNAYHVANQNWNTATPKSTETQPSHLPLHLLDCILDLWTKKEDSSWNMWTWFQQLWWCAHAHLGKNSSQTNSNSFLAIFFRPLQYCSGLSMDTDLPVVHL